MGFDLLFLTPKISRVYNSRLKSDISNKAINYPRVIEIFYFERTYVMYINLS